MTRRLLRALARSAQGYGVCVTLEPLSETPWESATLSGSVYRVAVTALDPGGFDAWLIALPEADLPMPGQFVADLVVSARCDGAATVEIHTVAS